MRRDSLVEVGRGSQLVEHSVEDRHGQIWVAVRKTQHAIVFTCHDFTLARVHKVDVP